MARQTEKIPYDHSRLKGLLKEKGITLKGLGEELEKLNDLALSDEDIPWTESNLRAMRRDGNMTPKRLDIISRYLDCDIDYLTGLIDDRGTYEGHKIRAKRKILEEALEEKKKKPIELFIRWIYSDLLIFTEEYMKDLQEISRLLNGYCESHPEISSLWTPEFHIHHLALNAIAEDKKTIGLLVKILEKAISDNDTELIKLISMDGISLTKK